MKNTAVKVLLVMTIISAIFLCVLLYLVANRGSGKGQGSKLKEYQEQYDAHATNSRTLAPEIYYDFSDYDEEETLYDTDRHTDVYERIEAMKRSEEYTENSPLVVWNPYGVNALSLYVYFETDIPMKASYRVSAKSSELPTFSAECYAEEEYTTTHEYLLLGLFAEQSNRVSITMVDEEENAYVRTFWVEADELFGEEKSKLEKSRGTSEEKLSDGFFVHFGNETGERETVLFYDNDAVLRGEIPLLSGSCKRLLFLDDRMYFNVSDTQIVALNRFGRAERMYELEGYTIGNDYCIDEGQKKLLVLASKTAEEGTVTGVNDRVLSVDLISGEVKELLDMGVLLKEYKDSCKKNEEGVLEWLNLNSIQLLDTGLLLGAREPSAAFKINDIYEVPALDYIIGEAQIFENTGYESYLLTKTDDFASFYGANTMTCVKEEGMPKGVYYLYLYDNHIGGTESRPELDYSLMADDLGTSLKKGTSSYFCRYLINETAKTWQSEETVSLEYSGYAGSAQVTSDGYLVTDTAGRFRYSEFDSERNLICSYTSAGKEYLARVFKYDFKGFYFRGDSGNTATLE